MRTPFIAANWKMHMTIGEAILYVGTLRARMPDRTAAEVVLAPPFTALRAVADAVSGLPVGVAGQNLHWEPDGAYTGETSGAMLKEAGASHVIIGHSERRRRFAETDDGVNRKTHAALAVGLVPIVCVGETLDERDAGTTLDILDRQVALGLRGLNAEQVVGLVVAYEPVWAIGTGRTATPAEAQAAHAHIRARISDTFGSESAVRCRLIYGGSVKPANAGMLSAQPDVDGALVGGAGLDPGRFADILAQIEPTPL